MGEDFKGTNGISELSSVVEIQLPNSSTLFEGLISKFLPITRRLVQKLKKCVCAQDEKSSVLIFIC